MIMAATSRNTLLVSLVALLAACENREPLTPSFAKGGATIGAPTHLTATAASHRQIWFAWQDNASNESGYEVWRSDNGAAGSFSLFTTYPWPNTTAGGNDLLNAATEYCYKVRAYKGTRQPTQVSAFSNVACATTLPVPVPAAPSGVSAAPTSGGSIRISWTDNASDESAFRIERAAVSAGPWTNLGSANPNVLSFEDQQPPALEQPECYRVFALNSFGDSPASNVVCTARPTPPSGLTATATGSDIELTWIDNSGVEDGFEIRRWTVGVSTVIAIVSANTIAYRDAGLPDDTYWYQVRARRDGGNAGSSNNAGATILTSAPNAPSNVSAFPGSSTRATVVWVDNSANESGFLVKRSTDGGASWETAGGAGPNETTFYDNGQPSEPQLLCYSVIAWNSLGESAPSSTDCSTLPRGPSGLTLTEIDATTIDFAWTDNSSVEEGYEVDETYEYCDEDGSCASLYFPIATLAPNTMSYRASALGADAYYVGYVVVAIKQGGRSDVSNTAVPVPISNLSARADSPGQIDLAWTSKIADDWVWITRCEGDAAACASGAFIGRGYASRSASTFSDTGVEVGKTYSYRVYTYADWWNRYSAPSNIASATSR
jgi:titin